ncbi:serine/threonine-protein phosphatase 6 regulatory ankyrin repeat subunit A-like [Uloborus diversus]|uniref:serine/threonine-protein phosphatase 6 regulatory ankyrin repeat subunit A-like n=1 Tax=Uloborus diversus TaxID=327109 RepID=UPI002409B71D|nr:serine/threonine-protein phosphatase 6 regulatory ankyrin repeat subunit A-like [Uloborus diversus]
MNSGDGCGANRELPSTSKRQSEDSEEEPPRKRVEACHDASGEMKLHRAIRCSDRCATLAISTAEPKDFGMQDERGRTALHEAVYWRSAEVVKMLLAAWSSSHLGATHPLLEIQDNEGRTALHVAVYRVRLEVVEMLLAARTDINPRDANGRKPLIHIQNKKGRTALHEAACDFGGAEMVAVLLAAGANTHLQDKWGQTALHVAINSRKKEIAEVICDADDRNVLRDHCGRTVLHFAAERGMQTIVRKLLSSGPLRKTLRSGKESTSNAAEGEGIALSASKEDLVDVRDNYGMTALHLAAQRGFTEIVELLLAAGTDPLLQTKEGRTALHLAIDCYREDIAEILCGAEEGNHLQDQNGRTALHYAASEKSKRTVRNLLFNGEHPHTMDNGGSSPLQLAFVVNGDNSVAEMIISFIAWKDISVDWKNWNARRVEIFKKRMEECLSEIRRMKETKVLRRNITYYDVAARHVGKVADYLESPEFRDALLGGGFARDFPNYADFIDFKVKKAERRRILRAPCLKCFETLFGSLPPLPGTILYDILAYLSERDMQNVLAAFNCDVPDRRAFEASGAVLS